MSIKFSKYSSIILILTKVIKCGKIRCNLSSTDSLLFGVNKFDWNSNLVYLNQWLEGCNIAAYYWRYLSILIEIFMKNIRQFIKCRPISHQKYAIIFAESYVIVKRYGDPPRSGVKCRRIYILWQMNRLRNEAVLVTSVKWIPSSTIGVLLEKW